MTKHLIITFVLCVTLTAIWAISINLIFHPPEELFAGLAIIGGIAIAGIVTLIRV